MKGVLKLEWERLTTKTTKLSIDENCQTHLPELCTNLVTTLSSLNVNDFPHCIDEFDERLNAMEWKVGAWLLCLCNAVLWLFELWVLHSSFWIFCSFAEFWIFRGILDFLLFSREMREDVYTSCALLWWVVDGNNLRWQHHSRSGDLEACGWAIHCHV